MEPIKLTIKEVNEKAAMLNSIHTNANDKLNYAIKKVYKNIEKGVASEKTAYNRKIEDARIKYASTYPKDHPEVEKRGLLITNAEGAYSYTPEATAKFNEETRPINDAFESTIIDVEPYHAKSGAGWERVDTLDLFIKEELTGLLFDPTSPQNTEETKVAAMHVEYTLPTAKEVVDAIQFAEAVLDGQEPIEQITNDNTE